MKNDKLSEIVEEVDADIKLVLNLVPLGPCGHPIWRGNTIIV